MPHPISVEEALIWVMTTTAAADRRFLESELAVISDIVRTMPAFAGFDADIADVAAGPLAFLEAPDGIELILETVEPILAGRLAETAYALAVEVAAADMVAPQEELVFLEMLRERLDIDPLAAAAIERSARVRYRRLEPQAR